MLVLKKFHQTQNFKKGYFSILSFEITMLENWTKVLKTLAVTEEMKNKIKGVNMHVQFNFFREVTKRPPSFIKSGGCRELQSCCSQLKIYLIFPYYSLSKRWSGFYLSKCHHRNLTKYKIRKSLETVRCLNTTHLSLTLRRLLFIEWAWLPSLNAPSKYLSKNLKLLWEPEVHFKHSMRFCPLLQNAFPFVIINIMLSLSMKEWLVSQVLKFCTESKRNKHSILGQYCIFP